MIFNGPRNTHVNTILDQDMINLLQALSFLESQKLTPKQFGTLKGIMSAYDKIDDINDATEDLLYNYFQNDFSLGGAVTQVIHIAEKYGNNPASSKIIKDQINDTLVRLLNKGFVNEPIAFVSFEHNMQNLIQALSFLESEILTPEQFGTFKGFMSVYDDSNGLSDEASELLYDLFQNQFTLIGALAQVIHITNEYADNIVVSKQIEDIINDSIERLQVEGMARRPKY